MSHSPSASRAILLLLFPLLAILAVFCRCVYLQHVRHDAFVEQAARQQLKLIPLQGRRGLIVDRKGMILAQSVKRKSLAVDPARVRDVQATAEALAGILSDSDKPVAAGDLQARIAARRNKRFLWVKRFLSDEQAARIQALSLPGIILQTEYHREYPLGELAAHVVGFTDIDGQGLEGIEKQYDEDLRGQDSLWRMSSDVGRRAVFAREPLGDARDGHTIVTTLDCTIQDYLQEQLSQTVDKFQAEGACGIVVDPRSSEILALALTPTYNAQQARQVPAELRRNRALTDPVEPGSIFKPFTIASALQGGFCRMDEVIDCEEGPYRAKGLGVIREYKYYHGMQPVSGILVHSSNIGSAKIAQRMGKDYFYPMIERFGYGSPTGIDLPGEGGGILVPLQEWRWGDYALTRASFGQGPVAATPIQVMQAFCVLANGGRFQRPRVVRAILSSDAQQVVQRYHTETEPARQVIAPEIARQVVTIGLRGVVQRRGGSANKAEVDGYEVFGKSGTAQVPRKDGRGYEDRQYISSFIAGAPASDPRLCCLIMVYRPDRSLGLGYTGGAVAASAVGRILEYSLAYLGVPPQQADADTAMAWQQ